MKDTKFGRIVSAMAMVLYLHINGYSQTYFYSGPISGRTDVALNPGVGYYGGFVAYFGTLDATIYYNSVSQTLRQVGTVTVNPASGSFDMRSRFDTNVYGHANLFVGNGSGSFSFDTFFFASESNHFSGNLSIPVIGTVSFNIILPLTAQIISASPTSLVFSEGPTFGQQTGQNVGGYYTGTGGDNQIYYSWVLNSVVATAVPEPGTFSMFVGAIVALGLCRRF